MPFGLRSATLACQRTTQAVAWILRQSGHSIDVYIDDFYGAEHPALAQSTFDRLSSLLNDLGLQASEHKDVPPQHEILCLGILVNSRTMTISVPPFRVNELQEDLLRWSSLSAYKKRDLQTLLGKLSFVAACVPPGRVFMARLLNALSLIDSRHTILPVTSDNLADVNWWLVLLKHFNGTSIISAQTLLCDTSVFATDACLTGCGAICHNEYFHHNFPAFLQQYSLSISELELLTIVVAIKLWAPKLSGTDITLQCDNMSCVHMINKKRSRNKFMQRCLRELWLYLSLSSIRLSVVHVPTRDNVIPDILSRWDSRPFMRASFHRLTADRKLVEIQLEDSIFDCHEF